MTLIEGSLFGHGWQELHSKRLLKWLRTGTKVKSIGSTSGNWFGNFGRLHTFDHSDTHVSV